MSDDSPSFVEIYASLRVVQSQQTEINRRLGLLEKGLDALAIDPQRIEHLEERLEGMGERREKWSDWFWQAVVWVVGVTAASLAASYLGLEVRS